MRNPCCQRIVSRLARSGPSRDNAGPGFLTTAMENPDFIEVYENALAGRLCSELIQNFEASSKLTRGATGGGVNTELKDSWDLCISLHDEWKQAEYDDWQADLAHQD